MLLPSLVLGILFRNWHVLGKHSIAELHGQNPISIISLILTVVWILLHTCALVCVEVRRQLLGVGPGPTPESLGLELGSGDLEMCFKLTSPDARSLKFFFCNRLPRRLWYSCPVYLWTETTNMSMNQLNRFNSRLYST